MKIENFLAFAGGVVAGGALLMMLAPKSREEMCTNIKHKMSDAKRSIGEAMDKHHFKSCDCEHEMDNDMMASTSTSTSAIGGK